MTIHYVTIKGRIRNRKLEFDVPPNAVEGGEVEVQLPVIDPLPIKTEPDWKDQPWTQEELDELLTLQPSTLGEILAAGLAVSI